MPWLNQPSVKSLRSDGAAWGSTAVHLLWLVPTNLLLKLSQSSVGRSCIHQWPLPQWLKIMSMTTFMPRAWALSMKSMYSSIVPKRGSMS